MSKKDCEKCRPRVYIVGTRIMTHTRVHYPALILSGGGIGNVSLKKYALSILNGTGRFDGLNLRYYTKHVCPSPSSLSIKAFSWLSRSIPVPQPSANRRPDSLQ